MATSDNTTALKVDYKSPLNITERQVQQAIEIMQQKAMPHDRWAEELVIGAMLITSAKFEQKEEQDPTIVRLLKVRNLLKPKDFYFPEHQTIFDAITTLVENRKSVDLLTVTDQLKRMNKLAEVGGPVTLVELSGKIGSTEHALDHARIVLDHSLRRDAILKNYLAVSKMFDPASDVFEVRNELADDLRVMPLTSFLRTRTATERMEDGKNMPRIKQMCGSLWKQGEMVFLFAGPKRGKSIFAMQMADAISKGEGLFDGLLANEVGPQKIGYIDFELMDNEFSDRYYHHESHTEHEFSENFIIIDQNPDFTDYDSNLERVIFSSIEEAVLTHKLDAIIIDNITWMAQVATSDTQAALDLMRRLDQLKKRMHISILILAHSPKINAVLPLDENMMGGSKHLSNFSQGVFAIGKSAIDPNVRYIKECVRRNGRLHYDDENVIQVEIDRVGGMLKYCFMGTGPEAQHLSDPNDADTKVNILAEAVRMRKNTPKSFGDIFTELNIQQSMGWSKRHFTRLVQKEMDRLGENIMFKEDANTDEPAPFKPDSHAQVSGKANTGSNNIPF